MYAKLKILGHPIHPMLVAYPIALFTVAFVTYIVYAVGNSDFWFKVAAYAGFWGLVTMAVAMIFGIVDFLGVPAGTAAKRHGLIHLIVNVGVAVCFIIITSQYMPKVNAAKPPSATLGIIFSAIAFVLLVVSGYFGFELTQHDQVGTVPRTTPERAATSAGNR